MIPHLEPFDKADLIVRHLRGELKTGEEAVLMHWLAEDSRNQQFYDALKDEQELEKHLAFFKSVETDAAWAKIAGRTVDKEAKVIAFRPGKAWLKYAAAIALLLLAFSGFLLLKHREAMAPSGTAAASLQSEAGKKTGADKARLTLEDGTEVILEDLENGLVLQQKGIKVIKQGGQLVYQVAGGSTGEAVTFNTISTPVGGQYQIVLPDGSKVWLNAASSLRFPTAFAGSQRQVELKGEGYFEVAKNKQPFIVQAEDARVEVLGTHFNIKAYANETGTQTTLLEGSVKVSQAQASLILKPGQQAWVQPGQAMAITQPDTEAVMAWKQGLFQFNKASLKFISLELERWYGVGFEHNEAMAKKHFSGVISRNNDISQVLHMLELSGDIKFEKTGNKIRMSPKKAN